MRQTLLKQLNTLIKQFYSFFQLGAHFSLSSVESFSSSNFLFSASNLSILLSNSLGSPNSTRKSRAFFSSSTSGYKLSGSRYEYDATAAVNGYLNVQPARRNYRKKRVRETEDETEENR